MINNAGVSVWETWKYKVKMMIKRALILFRLTLRIYVTTTIWKSVSIRLKAQRNWVHRQALMKTKMVFSQSLTIWISTSFMNQAPETKPHPQKYLYLNSSWISQEFSMKTSWPSKTYSLWTLMKSKPFSNTWKNPDSKFKNKKFMTVSLTSKIKI